MSTNQRRNLVLRGALAACLLAAACSGTAHAQTDVRWCSGTMTNLLHYSNGDVMVMPSWRNDYVRICSLHESNGQTAITNCAAWLSTLRDAVRRQASTIIFFNAAPACNAMPTYSSTPPVGYVMLNN